MNRFFHVVYIIIKPIICLLFPHRAVGLENVPEGGALLCANHASGWDPFIIAVCLPNDSRLAFMAKEQIFRIPLVRWLITKLGAFPVKRGGSDLTAMKTAMKRLNDGGRLIIFPEGTRVDRQGEAEAKGGVTVMSARTGAPMIPIYCGGKHKLFRRTTVVFGEPYHPVIAGRRPTAEENQRSAGGILGRIYSLGEENAGK